MNIVLPWFQFQWNWFSWVQFINNKPVSLAQMIPWRRIDESHRLSQSCPSVLTHIRITRRRWIHAVGYRLRRSTKTLQHEKAHVMCLIPKKWSLSTCLCICLSSHISEMAISSPEPAHAFGFLTILILYYRVVIMDHSSWKVEWNNKGYKASSDFLLLWLYMPS